MSGLADNIAPQSSPSLLSAVAANTPGVGADLFVTIPAFGPHEWGPCKRGGWASPSAGDECLVGLDENGVPWIVSF